MGEGARGCGPFAAARMMKIHLFSFSFSPLPSPLLKTNIVTMQTKFIALALVALAAGAGAGADRGLSNCQARRSRPLLGASAVAVLRALAASCCLCAVGRHGVAVPAAILRVGPPIGRQPSQVPADQIMCQQRLVPLARAPSPR